VIDLVAFHTNTRTSGTTLPKTIVMAFFLVGKKKQLTWWGKNKDQTEQQQDWMTGG
jgi:hypothetical protein